MSAKPEIISTGVGYHNLDLAKSTLRIVQGGSWKRQRVIVIVPSADMIAAKVAMSHWSLGFPPNQSVHRMLCLGQEVGDAYSTAIAEIVAHPDLSQWEYILTIESDNCPQPDALVKLLERMDKHPEFSAISGLYWCKGPAGVPHCWGDISDPVQNYRPQPVQPGELKECYGLSMGFTLYRMSLFKDERLRKPWFKTLNGSEGNGMGTQDLYAWSDFRKHGHRCAVDGSVLIGHWDHEGKFGQPQFMW
jgi:hypothetical protein